MLPEKFKESMKEVLGEEAPLLFASLEEGENVRGVRYNPIKTDRAGFLDACPFPADPLSYDETGFFAGEEWEGIGSHPMHHAGMIYMQDPGAMATVCAAGIGEGSTAIDLCAAPGGKSSQISGRIGGKGFLLSNEFVPKRAKITVGNFERLGIRNAFVTSADTGMFRRFFRHFFDLVLADVPCSGEGMFRKSEDALAMWSPETVALCAARSAEILENAVPLVASGGKLLYSTCTWSLEENERIIDRFLTEHPEFHLIPVREEVAAVTRPGVVFEGARHAELVHCRRFYPHVSPGEGQFIAVIEKDTTGEERKVLYGTAEKALSKEENKIVDAFLAETLAVPFTGRVVRVGDNIVMLSHDVPVLPHSLFSAGVLLGEIRSGRVIPSHQFFSCYGKDMKNRAELSDSAIRHYLCGEELDAPTGENGFVAVLWHGVPVGGGKAAGGRLKNYYPKGLRNAPGNYGIL